jgi:hypothetical protein
MWSHPSSMSKEMFLATCLPGVDCSGIALPIDLGCCEVFFNLIRVETKECNLWLSGGRFGYLASNFSKMCNSDHSIELTRKIQNKMTNDGVDLACFSVGSEFPSILTSKSKMISYLIADITTSFNSADGTIGRTDHRNEIKRMTRKASKGNVEVCDSDNPRDLVEWYRNCYLPRMTEIKGVSWSLEIFLNILKNGAKLQKATIGSRIVGGCVFLQSNDAIEVIAIGTQKEFQSLGVNYAIISQIFASGFRLGIQYFSWQGSNPPSGGIYEFKKQWNAETYTFKQSCLVTRNFEKEEIEILRRDFPNFFIYPTNENE